MACEDVAIAVGGGLGVVVAGKGRDAVGFFDRGDVEVRWGWASVTVVIALY